MDLYSVYGVAKSLLYSDPSVSSFEDVPKNTPTKNTPTQAPVVVDVGSAVKKAAIVGIVSLVVSILIGLFAAYLSWTCHENVIYSSVPARILFAIFAFLFGTLYLIIYALFKTSNCSSRGRNLSHRR